MKAYQGFEAKKSGFTRLPVAGAYVGEIQGLRVEKDYDNTRDVIVLMLEITDGEYKNRYHEVLKEQQERFGGDVKYRGTLRIKLPAENDGDDKAWIRSKFENAVWCIEQSNEGYEWDWNEEKWKGKKVGFSVRDTLYTGADGNDRQSTEIGQLESIKEVRDGKVKPMKARDSRNANAKTEEMTNVTNSVDVPF